MLSALSVRRRWMGLYLGFNLFLYSSVVILFVLFLFAPQQFSSNIAQAIFLLASCFDLLLPCMLIASVCYFRLALAGFPQDPQAETALRDVRSPPPAHASRRLS